MPLTDQLPHSQEQPDSENDQEIKNPKKKVVYTRWSNSEQILYCRFLKANIDRMERKKFTKIYHKFKKMQSCILTKNSNQCRSHHQKMVAKHGSVLNIIEHLKHRIPNPPQNSDFLSNERNSECQPDSEHGNKDQILIKCQDEQPREEKVKVQCEDRKANSVVEPIKASDNHSDEVQVKQEEDHDLIGRKAYPLQRTMLDHGWIDPSSFFTPQHTSVFQCQNANSNQQRYLDWVQQEYQRLLDGVKYKCDISYVSKSSE